MPERVEKELKRIERLERIIEHSILDIEKQNSFSRALFYGIVLGVISNIGASVIYEILIRDLSSAVQIAIGVIMMIAVPILIIMLFREVKKAKKSREILNAHLRDVMEHKKSISQ